MAKRDVNVLTASTKALPEVCAAEVTKISYGLNLPAHPRVRTSSTSQVDFRTNQSSSADNQQAAPMEKGSTSFFHPPLAIRSREVEQRVPAPPAGEADIAPPQSDLQEASKAPGCTRRVLLGENESSIVGPPPSREKLLEELESLAADKQELQTLLGSIKHTDNGRVSVNGLVSTLDILRYPTDECTHYDALDKIVPCRVADGENARVRDRFFQDLSRRLDEVTSIADTRFNAWVAMPLATNAQNQEVVDAAYQRTILADSHMEALQAQVDIMERVFGYQYTIA
ncbi:hypothetical protein K490DRAFT_52565 [Saccharata proteae CBS 121410]|uniref:Uncharacterized protein n=1 Tax=Saccharata proteae CBS 121410 TaxID=1314787 RepID=A0A9P4I379_9PEZI|nr:hypothetical protein K490DRAFT_52565 [Saccharata proteae CBS 121410]